MLFSSSLLTSLLLGSAVASLAKRQTSSNTAIVNLGNNTGTPQHLASGILYGIPDTANQIPDSFYTGMGFNYMRAGGAQIPAPGRGWIWGFQEYKNRFASAISNYKTARKYNAPFIFLIHDLWGADGTQNSSAPYPGDNNNWSSWDAYLTHFISDIKANSATAGLQIDIWNEPDLGVFWNRSMDQYLQLWGRTYARLRRELPNVLLLGPALSQAPDINSAWWNNYLSFVAKNASVPDQYVWHMEGGGGDTLSMNGALTTLLKNYGLPQKQINIDEYAVYNEQCPAGSAWFIGQLERINAIGLRGNWASSYELHDYLAGLVSKPNAGTGSYSPTAGGYFANGDWRVYQYYANSMTGHRVGSLPSGDNKLDVYGTVGTDMVRLLLGVRITSGTWYVTINGFSKVGLPTSGTLRVHAVGFPYTGGHFGRVDSTNDLGYADHAYSGDTLTLPVYQQDTTTAYAYEFAVGS